MNFIHLISAAGSGEQTPDKWERPVNTNAALVSEILTEYFLLLFILALFHLVFDVVVEQIIKLKMKQGPNTRQGFTIYARVMCERFYVNEH